MTAPLEIPGYQIQSVLGEGGMATVYLAVQTSLERPVALKVMSSALLDDKSFCERFLVEGRTVGKLQHPAIVNIYDIGCHDSNYYMAMEYVEGGCLTDRLKTSIGALEALTIIRSIAGALGYAHEHGFVHRDVKPANILFRESGEATLTDFGIAKATESDIQLTQLGCAIGTPEYMSPEQAQAEKLDGRSDLYSLGIVLHELLTGRRPFTSENACATALMHINNPVPVLPGHLAVYQSIIDRLLAKSPDDRFENARHLIQALDNVLGNKTIEYGLDTNDRTRAMPAGGAANTAIPDRVANAGAAAQTEQVAGSPLRLVLPLAGVAVLAMTGLGYYLSSDSRVAIPETTPEVSQPSPKPAGSPNQKRIKRLLQVAAAHKAIGRLKEPPGANAYDAYKMVLNIDPDNAEARQGMQEIERTEPSN